MLPAVTGFFNLPLNICIMKVTDHLHFYRTTFNISKCNIGNIVPAVPIRMAAISVAPYRWRGITTTRIKWRPVVLSDQVHYILLTFSLILCP
jgi:hypothetical protein